jgi:hypothetical protein
MSDQRIQEIEKRRNEAARVTREKGWMHANNPSWDDIDYLLSLLDGKAPTISEAIAKVEEARDDNKRSYVYWKSVADDPNHWGVLKFAAWAGEDDRIIETLKTMAKTATLESPQSTPVDGQRCVLCGHEGIVVNGQCVAESRNAPGIRCGCKCEFSVGKEAGEQRELTPRLLTLIRRAAISSDLSVSEANEVCEFIKVVESAATSSVPVAEPEEEPSVAEGRMIDE